MRPDFLCNRNQFSKKCDEMGPKIGCGYPFVCANKSSNALAIASAVLTDLAIGFLPESALQPGMRVIAEDKDLPRLRDAEIALKRASHAYGGIYEALADHIVTSMGNLEARAQRPLAAAAE